MTVFQNHASSTSNHTSPDKLTSAVFARARATGFGYHSEPEEMDLSSSNPPGLPRQDADSPLSNPYSQVKHGLEGIKARASHNLSVSPPAEHPQRMRFAPSPRIATLVAVFLLTLTGLIIAWQVFSAPPSQPVAGTVVPSGKLGEALNGTKTVANSRSDRSQLAVGHQGVSPQDATEGNGEPRQTTASPELFLPGSNGSEVVVYVSGQVSNPGVVHLANPSRVADALTAAGGPKPEADLQALNLARLVTDGEQINVPLPGETPPPEASLPNLDSAPTRPNTGGQNTGNLVNLNTADTTTLQTLSGIGPALAQRIIDYRQSNGKFASIDQLDEVSGIGPAMLDHLRPHVTVK